MRTLPSSRAEAKRLGAKRYFTGKPCRRGHLAERLTYRATCVLCAAENEARPERVEFKRQWLEKNAERQRENIRKWREQNTERTKETNAAWMAQNRSKHNEAVKNLKRRKPERVRVYAHNRRSRAKGELSPDLAQVLLKQQEYCCACPCRGNLWKGFHMDHIIPLVSGGLNVDSNIQLLTPACNLAKAQMSNEDFMKIQRLKYEDI